MTTHRLLGALVLGLSLAGLIQAQNRQPSGMPAPRLYVVAPAGGKVGSTVEITVTGLNLEDPEKVVFSNPGLKAELVPTPPPVIDPKTKKPKAGAPKLTEAKFKVTIPAGTPLGNHDLRVVNKWGVSNPRVFQVGDLNEVAEVEPNNDLEAPNKPQRVELNTTVNASFNQPSDVDYYVFKATKGQRVVVSVLSSTIDSRAQPAVELYDARGRQLGENVFYRGDDALVDLTAPEDGDYHVRVFQFTHTFRTAVMAGSTGGGTDNFYRLSISTAPWIDSVVPSVIEPGKTVNVTVYGRNLPGGKLDPSATVDGVALEKATVSVTAPADGVGKLKYSGRVLPSVGFMDGFELRLKNASGSSNPFLIGLARAAVTLDTGDNDSPEKAQAVTLPCEIAGVIEKRNDNDWYRFTAKKGDTWSIKVISHQLGAPTFMTISLRNPKTMADLYEAPLEPNTTIFPRRFFRRTEDPMAYKFTAPDDGEYQLLVTSRASGTMYGPRHTYAVRITKDEEDFKLVALGEEEYVPSVTTVPAGGSQAFNVIIDREGDFGADVELTVEGLPPGVTCPPQVLSGNVRETTFVLTAAPSAAPWAGPVRIKGTATIDGKKVVREARSASIVWPVQPQGNIPTMSRLDHETWLAVRGAPVFVLTPTIDKATLVPGDKAVVKLKLDRKLAEAKAPVSTSVMQVQNRQGSELPTNLRFGNNAAVNIAPGQAEGTFAVTVGNDVPPGTYNVVFRGQSPVPFNKDPMAKARPNVNAVAVSAPLTVTVLPKALATLSVSTPNPTVKIGQQTEVVVRVARLHRFTGEFKVQLVLPPGAQGVEAAEVTIPANATEAKLLIKAPAGAAPGGRANLVVKATALWNGKVPTTHETKINVNVTK